MQQWRAYYRPQTIMHVQPLIKHQKLKPLSNKFHMHVIKCRKDTEVHKRRHFKPKGHCHFREVERLYIIDLFEGMRVVSSDVGFVGLLS